MEVYFANIGYCKQLNNIALKGGRFYMRKFPALVALIKHPTEGNILIDTGYSKYFFKETRKFPEILYRWITPVSLKTEYTLESFLNSKGVKIGEIKYVLFSHFHADHIAGSKEVTNAKFVCSEEEFRYLNNKSRIIRVLKGFIKGLLPDDFEKRVSYIENKKNYFNKDLNTWFQDIKDVFGDESILAIPLKGHSYAQYGFLVDSGTTKYFFIGDACWTKESYEQGLLPNSKAFLIFEDKKEYIKSFKNISFFRVKHPNVTIVPTHGFIPITEKEIKNE